jgi:hypothetical protein
MANRKTFSKHLNASAVTAVTTKSCYVHSVVIVCSNAGTGWTILIQDGTGNVLIPTLTLTVPVDGLPNVDRAFEKPVPMRQGINITTAGTPGIADVSLACSVTEEE